MNRNFLSFMALRLSFRAGNYAALYEALNLCLTVNHDGQYVDSVPKWLLEACNDVVLDRMKDSKKLHPGVGGSETATFLINQKHLKRFLAVQNAKVDADGNPVAMRYAIKQAKKTLTLAGDTVEIQTIRKSYHKVNNVGDDPMEAAKYLRLGESVGDLLSILKNVTH